MTEISTSPPAAPAPAPERRTTGGADGLPMPRRLWAILAISFGTSLFVIDGNIANVALPTIAEDLGVSGGAVVAVVTLYQLVLVMGLLPFGGLGDLVGHRRLYQTGQLVFLLASAATFFVESFAMLLVVRAAQALGAGMALSVSAAMLRSIYPDRSLGSGLGINSIIVATSNAIAPTLGGFLVQHLDWRWVFVAAVPMAALSLLIGRTLPDPEKRSSRFDVKGGLWSAATFGAVIGGLELAVHGTTIPGIALAIAGLVSGWFFVQRERSRDRPILPVDLIGQRVIGLSVLAAVVAFMASASLVVLLPFRLENGMGYAPDEVGLLILPIPLTLLVIAPLAGWLSDRVKPSILGVGGMAATIAGFLAVAFMPNDAAWPDIAWRLALCGLGFGFFFAPNSRLIIGQAPQDRSASAGGLLSTSRLLGQTMGASMIGMLLAAGVGLTAIPLLIGAALALLAALCSIVRLRTT